MLGIGQLVAGIAHQIANPLDGVQNCLRRIGERVKDDPHLTEYVQLMAEASIASNGRRSGCRPSPGRAASPCKAPT